jgi:hypothetical protein
MAQVVEYLPSNVMLLVENTSTTKKQKQKHQKQSNHKQIR